MDTKLAKRRISDGNLFYNTLNDPKLADRWKTILTKDDLQDLNNLAIILRESGEIDKSVKVDCYLLGTKLEKLSVILDIFFQAITVGFIWQFLLMQL